MSKMHQRDAGIGIDLGSSSVRVGLFDCTDDRMINCTKLKVPYYFSNNANLWQYTQSTDTILTAIEDCFSELSIQSYNVKACAVSATCSLAVFLKKDKQLTPFNCLAGDNSQNVVFWMDSSAKSECKELNMSAEQLVKDTMGGNFIPEMGIPKLKRFINYVKSNSVLQNLTFVVMDLHRYIAYELARRYEWDYHKLLNVPNSNGIGHDGELSGWAPTFYSDVVKLPPNIIIGPEPPSIPLPNRAILEVTSCIDCYSSWLSMCSPSLESSLFLVGGTSTCYIYATAAKYTIPGVWGPFTNILDNDGKFALYEGGQSCTGNLIEHLFKTHPAARTIKECDWPELLREIEASITKLEKESGFSIHVKTRHMFFYGDFQGNRMPYADPLMSGMIIGETTDVSFDNLVYKYVCILEFLAFQVRLMVSIFNRSSNKTKILELRICGSQAKNERLLSLISIINGNLIIKIPRNNVDLSGVSGAFLLGKSSYLRKPLFQLVQERKKGHDHVETFRPNIETDDQLLSLLETKYQIHLDMAKQQVKYRQAVDESIGL